MPVQDQSIADFLDDLADRIPAPGGGATAALHVAQAAALVAMVGRYSDGPKYDASRDQISRAVQEAEELRRHAVELVGQDEAAFAAVSAAYARPKLTEPDKQLRQAAVAESLIGAAEPPIQVIAAAARVVELARTLVPIANPSLIADLAAAAEAGRAGAATGQVNIEVNLRGITDPGSRARCAAATSDADAVQNAAICVTAAVRARLAG